MRPDLLVMALICACASPPPPAPPQAPGGDPAATRRAVRDRASGAFDELDGGAKQAPSPTKVAPSTRSGDSPAATPPARVDDGRVVGAAPPLRGTGRGRTVDEAQPRALAALSRFVLSDLKSELTDVQSDINGRSRQQLEDRVSITSALVFKGVTYGAPVQVEGGLLEVEARLDGEGLLATASFLKADLSQPASALDDAGLRARVDRARILGALMTTKLANALSARDAFRDLAARAQEEAYRRLNQGIVVFDRRSKEVTVELDGEPLPDVPEHFLTAGSHAFVAKRPGHRTLRATFRVGVGQRKVIRLRFIKKTDQVRRAAVVVDKATAFLKDHLEAALSKFGIEVTSPGATRRAFAVRLDHSATRSGEQSKHAVTVFVEARRGEVVVKKVKATLDYYATAGTEDALLRKKSVKLLSKLVPALMGALDSTSFYEDSSAR